MGNAPSRPRVTAQDKAVLQVKLQKDKLLKYQKKSNLLLKSETEQIKKYLRENDKRSAKKLLKRTKYQETLLENVSNQLLNLENMIQNIEFKLVEKEFLKGLSNGNEILKKLNNEMNINDVEKLMDDVNDNIQYQEEIDQVLSTSIVGKDVEDEIDEELRQLEAEESAKNAPTKEELIGKLPSVHNLPEIKQEEPEQVEEEEKAPVKQKQKTAMLA